jgi:Glycosyl hydrolase family 3 N terminal domain
MFSGPIVGLLRRELGFSGVIVTDSVSMGGVQALHQLAAMRAAAAQGRVSAAQVQESARRVIALRQRWAISG